MIEISSRKNPKERKHEIKQLAKRLFLEKGYETTTVENILRGLNLSKGGFYHHFKSKEEILDQIIDDIITDSIDNIKAIIKQQDTSPVDKLMQLFSINFKLKTENVELIKSIYKLKGSKAMINKFNIKYQEHVAKHLTALLKQGKITGVFQVTHELETAEALLHLYMTTIDQISQCGNDPDRINRYLETAITIIEKVLGVNIDSTKFKKIFEKVWT